MRQTSAVAIVVALFTHGCAMERSLTKASDNRPCVANYSTEGGFWTGKQFKTYEDFPAVEKTAAFDKVVASIASSGWQVENSNKDLGIISASNTVSYGEGKTVPLNAVITNLTLSGGLATSADSVQEEFCKYLASVSS
jgi:protein-disulfide isomerase-like protein with CxxC motif